MRIDPRLQRELASKMSAAMNWEDAQEKLRKMREKNERKSEEVLEIWENSLADYSYKLGDDVWLIYEQVCIAACDCGRTDIAEICIEALKAKFSHSSMRVMRLEGLKYESLEQYETARELYDMILDKDETSSLARKRIVAILKAQNKIPEAITALNSYLGKFMSDYDSWMELCDLYLSEQDYSKAAYCMEELLISNPHNHLYHQKYAEIKYTEGGDSDMVTARKYFSQSLKLQPSNMRSLFGLFLAASNLASAKGSKDRKTENIKYASWAAEQISHKYKGKQSMEDSSQVKALEGMLHSLAITPSSSS